MSSPALLRLALPKGRMYDNVVRLLGDAGIDVHIGARGYRPTLSLQGLETKLLKPQNIVEMLASGSRDVGFAGADWVAELDAAVVELLDTGFDPVRLVAAAPEDLLEDGSLPHRRLVVASEYPRLTCQWIEGAGIDARLVHSYGATEVFPPEDADLIVDNTATGATLAANDLAVVDTLLSSSTRLYASPAALDDPVRRAAIEGFTVLLGSVLEARSRVMFEVNVPPSVLEAVCGALPCMREPTISPLHGGVGFALKAAVPRAALPRIVPRVKALGGSDIVITAVAQLVP